MISHKGVVMMKVLVLLLVVVLNASQMSTRYLLVQLKGASDKGIEGPLEEGPGGDGVIKLVDEISAAINHRGKYKFNRYN